MERAKAFPISSRRSTGRVSRTFIGILVFLGLSLGILAANAQNRPPNIIFVLADDLGYADIGSFGQEVIRTPNLDRLAAEGMRLTSHYAGAPVCAPARCVLMTGLHPGHAHIRGNRNVSEDADEPVPLDTPMLSELIKQQGYATGAFGKWGLGGPGSIGDPLRRGFDRFFGYLAHGHAHNHYPAYLWSDGQRIELNNPPMRMREPLPAGLDPNDPASYRIYQGNDYAPDLFGEQARRFIRENRNRPFFLYYPTAIPHTALQVPEDSLAEYLGLFPDPPYVGEGGGLPHHAPKAAYAAMITRLDREIGRMMELVRELGLERDTIFVFTSDNGAVENTSGAWSENFKSNGILRGQKRSLYEGGVRVPLIVRWTGTIRAGSVSERITGFEDWIPTLLELAGAPMASPAGIDGISFAPTLLGSEQPPRPFLYREFAPRGGQQAVWIGEWKGVRQNLSRQNPPHDLSMELYNLREDPSETRDLAEKNPDIVRKMARIMRDERVPSPLFPIPILDALE